MRAGERARTAGSQRRVGWGDTPAGRWRQVFRGDEAQIRGLRRWVTELLPECPARDDVITVASELAANAVKHTASGRGGWFAAEISWHATAVRIVVADQGAPGGPRLIDDPMAENGRGLQVVRGLSARTGAAGGPHGRLVWAEIPWAVDGPQPFAFPDGCELQIRDGEEFLAHRHAGVLAWFGRSTLQWWALTKWPGGGRLVTAESPQELSQLLNDLHGDPSQQAAGAMACWVRPTRVAGRPGQARSHVT